MIIQLYSLGKEKCNMFGKKLLKKVVAIFLGLGFLSAFRTSAFNDIAHKYITRSSYDAFVCMEDNGANSKNSPDVTGVSEFFKNDEEDYKELLVKYSVQPDIDETQGMYKYHFYNPVTETNFMNEKESALVRFKKHFENAVTFYRRATKARHIRNLVGQCILWKI